MSKRTSDQHEVSGGVSLKGGERPENGALQEDEAGPFEDDFEDEFESEDEIMVAGADGEPDTEEQEVAGELGGT